MATEGSEERQRQRQSQIMAKKAQPQGCSKGDCSKGCWEGGNRVKLLTQ